VRSRCLPIIAMHRIVDHASHAIAAAGGGALLTRSSSVRMCGVTFSGIRIGLADLTTTDTLKGGRMFCSLRTGNAHSIGACSMLSDTLSGSSICTSNTTWVLLLLLEVRPGLALLAPATQRSGDVSIGSRTTLSCICYAPWPVSMDDANEYTVRVDAAKCMPWWRRHRQDHRHMPFVERANYVVVAHKLSRVLCLVESLNAPHR
jgi:hypothetical protein